MIQTKTKNSILIISSHLIVRHVTLFTNFQICWSGDTLSNYGRGLISDRQLQTSTNIYKL